MKFALSTVFGVLFCLSGMVSAKDLDSNWYMSVNAGAMRYQQDGLQDFELTDYRLVVGKNINRVFAVEAHAGTGGNDTRPIFGVPVKLSVDYYVAGFARANLTLSPEEWMGNRLRLYGMLGGTYVETTSSDIVTTRSGTQESFSAGVGIEMFVDNIAIQLGYTRYVHESHNNNDYSLDSAYIGVVYEFGNVVE